MICLISPTYQQARNFAHTQNLSSDEWFYASDKADLQCRMNYHVLVIGEFPEERISWFEKMYSLAKVHGGRGRG